MRIMVKELSIYSATKSPPPPPLCPSKGNWELSYNILQYTWAIKYIFSRNDGYTLYSETKSFIYQGNILLLEYPKLLLVKIKVPFI